MATQPRSQTGTSVPGLISLLQTEWDGLMLEIHTLKQHLNTARQELTQALYQHEAACRVISRLIRERDQAREELARLRDLIKSGAGAVETKGITETLAAKFNELSDALSAARKSRKPPADLTKEGDFANFNEVHSAAVHSGAITCLELTAKDPNLVLTGGKDHLAHLYHLEQKAAVATFSHDAKITAISFVPTDMLTHITCASNGTAKVWEVDTDSAYSKKLVYSVNNHKKSITGCSVHPYTDYCLFCSKDGSWSFHDLIKGELVQAVEIPDKIPIHSGQIHPDGLMVATGLANGHILVWDIRNQEVVHELEGHKGPVTKISYSEKGYQMLSVGKNDSTALLWDLRKLATQGPTKIEAESVARSAVFDPYGTYFGVTRDVVEVYKARGAGKVAEIGAGQFTDMRFGLKDNFVFAGTADGSLKVFQ